jgi:hypothetical protein
MSKVLFICLAAVLSSATAKAADPDVCSSICFAGEKKCRKEAEATSAMDTNPPVTWSSSGSSGRQLPQEITGHRQVNVDDLKRERYGLCRDAYRLCIRDCGQDQPAR